MKENFINCALKGLQWYLSLINHALMRLYISENNITVYELINN